MVGQEHDTAVEDLREEIERLKFQLESFQEMFLETNSTIDILRRLKLSGYVQPQFQAASSSAGGAFSGGSFGSASTSRFTLRRGRFKVQYTNDLTLSQFVLQIDVTQNGVGIKDAYASIRDPWTRFVGLTAGVFDRPFGFEVPYSSSMRENPERSRMAQTLFPGERELGLKLEVLPAEMLIDGEWLSYFNLRVGVFNGTGPSANENDTRKDVIGRLGVELPFVDWHAAVDAGVSVYHGSARSNSRRVWSMDPAIKDFRIDSSAGNLGVSYDRTYIGGDLQLFYDVEGVGGFSVRMEAVAGRQPSTPTDVRVYTSTTADMVRRDVRGFYITAIQNVGTQHQFIVRYDEFDPNTDVSGTDIGATPASLVTPADVKVATWGFGYIFHWDDNVKFMLYYDRVRNELVHASAAGALAPFRADVKDDVLTWRSQFSF
jgi:hypothetical protein